MGFFDMKNVSQCGKSLEVTHRMQFISTMLVRLACNGRRISASHMVNLATRTATIRHSE